MSIIYNYCGYLQFYYRYQQFYYEKLHKFLFSTVGNDQSFAWFCCTASYFDNKLANTFAGSLSRVHFYSRPYLSYCRTVRYFLDAQGIGHRTGNQRQAQYSANACCDLQSSILVRHSTGTASYYWQWAHY